MHFIRFHFQNCQRCPYLQNYSFLWPLCDDSVGSQSRGRRNVSEVLLSDPEDVFTLQMVFHMDFLVSCWEAFLG